MADSKVICFGEILWDLLPTGKVAGGAPMNVAYHLNQLRVPAAMISRIGMDALGTEIANFLKSKKVPIGLVQRDGRHGTGIVQVELNEKGSPRYEIVEGVAWDFIHGSQAAQAAVKDSRAFIFGSLVARHEKSRQTLFALLELAPFKVFDVNLRQPFFSKMLLDSLLEKANFVKMNDEELDIISEWHGFKGNQQEKMTMVKNAFNLEVLLVTRGENGAICLVKSGFCSHPGYKVTVQDTIGSGDAFLAGYLSRYLAHETPETCLDFACRMGAFVATQRGGTPVLEGLEGIC